jgi:uncharacterized protein YutE (UPF0331/DUF86 family)
MKYDIDLIELLKRETELLYKASEVLDYSYRECSKIGVKNKYAEYTNEELDKYEALTSRFARLCDIFVQKLLRLLDELELEPEGTVRDRINRAEKKGIIQSADKFVELRILRNSIAHEYVTEVLVDIFKKVMEYTPFLQQSIEKYSEYIKRYIK